MSLAARLVRPVAPSVFVTRDRRPNGTVVVCAGDSITHGIVSANYVTTVQDRLGPAGYTLINAGISGDLAWNLLQRLDEVIACRPDVVTLLIGTNDVAAHISDEWRDGYRKDQHILRDPTLGWYREMLEAILDRFATETSATVVLIELPLLGEVADSPENRRVDEYNAALHAIGKRRGLPVLPLHQRMLDALPIGTTATPFDGTKKAMGAAALSRFLFRRSWNKISARQRLNLLTDHIHLNDDGADIVADLITDHLVSSRATA